MDHKLYRSRERTMGAPEDPVATDTTSAWSAMSLLKAIYAQIDIELAGMQPLDSDLTAIAALNTTSYGRSLLTLANAAALTAALDANLVAIAGLTRTRGDIIRGGASAWERHALGASGFHLQSDGTDAAWAGFLQSGSGAVARSWQTKVRESLYVEDFGAVGNGVTDDTAAIIAAITAAGPNGRINLRPNTTYAISASIDLFYGQMFQGPSGSGSTFGPTATPGSVLKWIGATGGTTTMVRFGADPGNSVNPEVPFGGGIRNVQLNCDGKAKTGFRFAACAGAEFENLKVLQPHETLGVAFDFTGNPHPSAPPGGFFDNAVRNCIFRSLNCFVGGTATGFRWIFNGDVVNPGGGATGCQYVNLHATFGYNSGGGSGYFLTSLDDCSFYNVFATRLAGGAGLHIWMNADAAVGEHVDGNTFHMVHLGGGGNGITAEGQYCLENKIYGLTGVDEVPTVTVQSGAELFYDYLGGLLGTSSGLTVNPPGRFQRADAVNNAVTELLRLRTPPPARQPTASAGGWRSRSRQPPITLRSVLSLTPSRRMSRAAARTST